MAKLILVANTPDTSNTMFNLAVEFVNQTSRNIFLTGKAGTGKTTFLKYIRENCPKQMAVVAPTGVAAVNAGGVTIHSFFQLPISPFIPESRGYWTNNEVADKHSLLSRMRLTTEKRQAMQELELLIIDEISMVRCDTLDAIDTVLRQVRQRKSEQFGGVQVLFIGDLFQLPPVVPGPEWQILSAYYEGPYFFDSTVIRQNPPIHLEFTKIYRQTEERLINLLNQIRNNELDEDGLATLRSRHIPGFKTTESDGYILLTTHNRKADETNSEKLQKINGQLYESRAVVEGEFPEKAFPAETGLVLKTGAQVMFLKNDSPDRGKRYFNGKIGIITKINDEKVFVQCDDDPFEIEVARETWNNIRYTINKETRNINEEKLGSFTQFPLRLAWAITIHKSQGLTFEKAIIDVEEAFAPGQVYVALSRCTRLNGMVLQSRIRPQSLYMDARIVSFCKRHTSDHDLPAELGIAKTKYWMATLLSLFDFSQPLQNCTEISAYVLQHRSAFNAGATDWLDLLRQNIQDMQTVAVKFQSRLKSLIADDTVESVVIRQRIKAASEYFITKVQEVLDRLKKSPAVTDSRLHAREYNDALRLIFARFAKKKQLLPACGQEFSLEEYQSRKQKFVLPAFNVNAYDTASVGDMNLPHPALHQQLRLLRDKICARKNLPVYYVLTGKTLAEMASYLPQTLAELEQISGFGKSKIENYGQEFLDIITKYSNERGLTSQMQTKSPKPHRKKGPGQKKDTKSHSFELFKAGKTIADIANERNLSIQTIEGHLAHYVSRGDIDIDKLVSTEKMLLIQAAIKGHSDRAIAPIKAKLGSLITFGEIRLVIAWRQFQNNHVD